MPIATWTHALKHIQFFYSSSISCGRNHNAMTTCYHARKASRIPLPISCPLAAYSVSISARCLEPNFIFWKLATFCTWPALSIALFLLSWDVAKTVWAEISNLFKDVRSETGEHWTQLQVGYTPTPDPHLPGVSQNTALAAPALHRPPKWVYFEYWNKTCFVALLVSVPSVEWIDRWHTDSQQCSEPWPQTAPVKATGSRQDYHDFEAPLLTMLLVLASQALTDWTRRFNPFLYRIDLYLGPVWTVRCFMTYRYYCFRCLLGNMTTIWMMSTPIHGAVAW